MRKLSQNSSQLFQALLAHRPIRLSCAVLSGFLLVLVFPDAHLSFLAWVALVPLIIASAHGPTWERCLLGFTTGAIALFGIHSWLFELSGFGWVQLLVLELIYASFYMLWSCSLSYLNRGRCSVYLLAFYWVILEYIRSHLSFMANPFAMLAHSQVDNLPLIQLASITGEYGISFLLILINLVLAKLILDPNWDRQIVGTILLFMIIHLWGSINIYRKPCLSKTVRIGVVQPCLTRSDIQRANSDELRLARVQKLTLSLTAQKPDLLVWPETTVRKLPKTPIIKEIIYSFAQYLNTPVITGASQYNTIVKKRGDQSSQNYNAAYYFSPDPQKIFPPYLKNILLPFGEYLPLENTINWPDWLTGKDFGISPGTKLSLFPLKDDINFSVLICWENLFSQFVRRVVQQDTDILVHLVNDNWFGNTPAPRQHNLASVFRAVENRVPVVVASNTGPSIIIDAYGRIVANLPDLFQQGAMVGEIKLSSQKTIYNRFGDWFPGLAAVIIISCLLWEHRQPRHTV